MGSYDETSHSGRGDAETPAQKFGRMANGTVPSLAANGEYEKDGGPLQSVQLSVVKTTGRVAGRMMVCSSLQG